MSTEKKYRKRKGKVVEIPPEWIGKTVHPQTVRKRPSHAPNGKLRRLYKNRGGGYGALVEVEERQDRKQKSGKIQNIVDE